MFGITHNAEVVPTCDAGSINWKPCIVNPTIPAAVLCINILFYLVNICTKKLCSYTVNCFINTLNKAVL